MVCPSGRPSSTDAAVSTASGASGDLSVLAGGKQESVPVTTGATSPVDSQDALVVRGSDALAPGLVGLRSGSAPLGALACTVPSPEQWFTGVGSRADHDSVIELVNPDAGPAVADITLLGPHLFSTGRLRGILIPGHKTITVDLGTVVPRKTLFTAHVVVSRGRLAVDVLDSLTDLVSHRTTREWLPRQLAPATTNQLLGLPQGAGQRTLQLANPSDNVVRAQVKVVTADTSFTPNGLTPVSVPPGATVRVPLSAELDKALGDGALGVSVVADEPLTASLVTTLDHDRVITVPAADVSGRGRDPAPGRDGAGREAEPGHGAAAPVGRRGRLGPGDGVRRVREARAAQDGQLAAGTHGRPRAAARHRVRPRRATGYAGPRRGAPHRRRRDRDPADRAADDRGSSRRSRRARTDGPELMRQN